MVPTGRAHSSYFYFSIQLCIRSTVLFSGVYLPTFSIPTLRQIRRRVGRGVTTRG